MPAEVDDMELECIAGITDKIDDAQQIFDDFCNDNGDADAVRRIKTFVSDRFDSFLSTLRS